MEWHERLCVWMTAIEYHNSIRHTIRFAVKCLRHWFVFLSLSPIFVSHNNNVWYYRAIAFAWIVIVTSAIPVAVSHGVLNYPYRGQNYTACVFQTELGYSLVAFQVNQINNIQYHYLDFSLVICGIRRYVNVITELLRNSWTFHIALPLNVHQWNGNPLIKFTQYQSNERFESVHRTSNINIPNEMIGKNGNKTNMLDKLFLLCRTNELSVSCVILSASYVHY